MVLRKKLTVLLMTLMVVMVASPLFGAHEVLAEDFLGTAGNDYLAVSPFSEGGGNYVYAGAGNDLIYAREEAFSYDRIDCGAGFDRVETIHSEDVTLRNCERTLGPAKGEIPE